MYKNKIDKKHSTINIIKSKVLYDLSNFHKLHAGNDFLIPDVLKYEYIKNPDNYGNLIYYSYKESVIGTLGAIAFSLNNNMKTLMLERVLVDKCYWGLGIFQELENYILRLANDKDVQIIWGLTPIPKTFKRVGYEIYDCLIDLELVCSKNLDFTHTHKLKVEIVNNNSMYRYKNYHKKEEGDDRILKYSKAKLSWLVYKNNFVRRYCAYFYIDGSIIGFCILRITRLNILRVDELILNNLNILPEVVNFFLKEANFHNLYSIRFYCNNHNDRLNKLIYAMKSLGFKNNPFKAKLIVKTVNKDIKFNYKDLSITGIWSPPYWAG